MAVQHGRTMIDRNLTSEGDEDSSYLYLVTVEQAQEDEESFREVTKANIKVLIDDPREEAKKLLATFGGMDGDADGLSPMAKGQKALCDGPSESRAEGNEGTPTPPFPKAKASSKRQSKPKKTNAEPVAAGVLLDPKKVKHNTTFLT